MEIHHSLNFPPGTRRAVARIRNPELSKLLKETGKKLIERQKLFLKHYYDGQVDWEEPDPKYERRKQRKTGSTEKFNYSGRAKKALTTAGKAMNLRVSGAKRRLIISLRRMKKGKNIYAIAQRGRYRGLEVSSRNIFGMRRTRRLEREETRGFRRRAGEEVSRRSHKPMPITAVVEGDERIARPVVIEEINRTMQLRGF